MSNEKLILEKINRLSEQYQNEIIDVIDFLLLKDGKISLSTIQDSINDIEKGNITDINNKDDLNKHFESLDL